MKLSEGIRVNSRFSRSASVERDSGVSAISGYVPTSRALDVVDRLARGMADASHGGRALSITGPHGGGKSSLALFLSSLFSPHKSPEFQAAFEILDSADADLARRFKQGLVSLGAGRVGALQGFVTASTEPVAATLARAVARAGAPPQSDVSPATVVSAVKQLTANRPLVLLVDEFGKNLEAYTRGSGDGDLFLLQTLAEMAQGIDASPLVIITMQHLAFGEYIQETSVAKRREWAKVQGRFHDVPFVESSGQSQALIASALAVVDESLAGAVTLAGRSTASRLSKLGLHDVARDPVSVYPIHPIVAAALPELCSRYGQNERTLFSFLAGPEPRAVPALLERLQWRKSQPLPHVGLDAVYDYFLDSASTSVSASSGSSRWLEIETRIRDSRGLTDFESSVLKSIGVLNLVSAGGSLRASRQVLDGLFDDASALSKALDALEGQGLITYREFADEFRVWSGSDFDVQGALETARRLVAETDLADLLNELSLLQPAVAGRHSQTTGILRVFNQRFATGDRLSLAWTGADSYDGVVLYLLGCKTADAAKCVPTDTRPCVLAAGGQDVAELETIAREAAAISAVLEGDLAQKMDWVAERELRERHELLIHGLRVKVATAWTEKGSKWVLASTGEQLDRRKGLSSLLSQVSDDAYAAAPRIPNELITRNQISSQAARARRLVVEAMLTQSAEPRLGLEGFGPERTIYDAVFGASGLHRKRTEGWSLGQPSDARWKEVWKRLNHDLEASAAQRLPLSSLTDSLAAPPFGLKEGLLPLLWVALLVSRAQDIALYEHGSLVLTLDDAVAERLVKNPSNFTFKYVASTVGPRAEFLAHMSKELGLDGAGAGALMEVARGVFRGLRQAPSFALTTNQVSGEAQSVRRAVLDAREPDELIFHLLPQAVGCRAVGITSSTKKSELAQTARGIALALGEVTDAYPALLRRIEVMLTRATGMSGSLGELRRQLGAQCTTLTGRVLDPRLQAFLFAATRDSGSNEEWLENMAMVVAGGKNPRTWTDEQETGFTLPLTEMGGALRRTSALLFEQLARDAGATFEARRITVTNPDGSERAEVVSIDAESAAVVAESATDIVGRLATQLGISEERACQTLLAWLAVRENVPHQASEAVPKARTARSKGVT